MKTTLFIALMFTTLSYSQKNTAYIGVGLDLRNAIEGSMPTGYKPALDFNIKAGAIHHQFQVECFYENFKSINFQSYGFFLAQNAPTLIKNLYIVNGIELGGIMRKSNNTYFLAGYTGEFRLEVSEKMLVGLSYNIRYRSDLIHYGNKFPTVNSTFLTIYYKLNEQ